LIQDKNFYLHIFVSRKINTMKRDIIHINEDLCDGCGLCIPNCAEGALQMIDGKARLISDLMCDGLGACIGHCPQEAITIEHREAQPYNETEVIKLMAEKGENTVVAHLHHLLDHNEADFVKEGMKWLKEHQEEYSFSFQDVQKSVHEKQLGVIASELKVAPAISSSPAPEAATCGCAGSAPKELKVERHSSAPSSPAQSMLEQWPVQFHLINPAASYFKEADLLLAADCSAFTVGDFHQKYLKGKRLIIACPKLDSGMDSYLEKLIRLIDEARINTIQVLMMEVPCCGGLMRLVQQAAQSATRKVPVKATVVSVEGKVLSEDWV
jgi:NAD-dependent dihydropyrimidine dehydrogenase PreA subunit